MPWWGALSPSAELIPARWATSWRCHHYIVSFMSQVVEQRLVEGGSVRFLRSHTPVIEFLALGETVTPAPSHTSSLSLSSLSGILRGSSPEKQLFYVTTPLMMDNYVAMDTVNVLVMGEVSSLVGVTGPKTTPTSFHHNINIGQFVWKK